MPVTLDDLLQLAGLGQSPQRPRRALPSPSTAQPSDVDKIAELGKLPEVPISSQAPPRPVPQIVEAPPSQDVRPRLTNPADEAQNNRIQSFGSSGEPFGGSSRPLRTQPRDYVADDLAYARDVERKPRNKTLDVLSGIVTGASALDGRPATPVDLSGRTRDLNEIYSRVGRELGVQGEQARIKSLGNQQDYRQQQVFGNAQKRMIDLYKSMPTYHRGGNKAIDEMFKAAGLEFEDKDPKTAKPGARHYFRMNGQEMILEPGATEAYAAQGQGGSDLIDPTQVPVTATGATSGQSYTVRPGTALGAEATASNQAATQGRFDTSEARQTSQFQTTQYQQQKERADKAAQDLVEMQTSADSDEAAARAISEKWQGQPFGQDAVDMVGYQSRAAARRNQAKSLADTVRRSYGDFYDVGNDGVPRPKATQAPAPVQPPASAAKPRLQVDHAKFEKMYAEAKTPEERAKLMAQYQAAIKAASQ